jgi:hypothetical protein
MINTGEINVNFACVNRPLRFDPSLVMFCKRLLQSACLSKAYLRAGVLAPNARHLVACATCLPPLGGRDAPLRLIRSSSEKIAIMRCQSRERLLCRVAASSSFGNGGDAGETWSAQANERRASPGLPIRTSQRGDSGTQAPISKVSRAGTKPQAKNPGLSITCERRDTPKQPAENRQADAGGRLVYWSRMAGLSTIR